MEFAGRLKKIRIKLIMIGICLIFLGGYSLIQEWKDQRKNTTKKVFDQYTDAFFKENISTNEITMHFFLENPEKYRLEQPKNLYPSMNQESILNEKIKISKEIEKLKKFKQKELTKKQQNTYMVLMDYLRRQKNLSMYPYYERILGKTSGQQAQILLTLSEYRLKNENYFKVLEMHPPDMVIHCGDAEGSEYALSSAAECPVYIVLGNNDFFSDLPREITLDIGSYKVWVTHGHNYYVSMGNETIKKEAIDRGVDIVLYGHTHRPVIDIDDDIIAVNPGSLSYPRQEGRQPSYAIMEIDRRGKVHFTIAYLRQ